MDELREQFREYNRLLCEHPKATLVNIPRSDGNIERRYRDGSYIFIAVTDAQAATFYGLIKDLRLH